MKLSHQVRSLRDYAPQERKSPNYTPEGSEPLSSASEGVQFVDCSFEQSRRDYAVRHCATKGSKFFLTLSIAAILCAAGTVGDLSAKVLSYEVRQDGIAAVGDVVAGKSADLVFLNSGYNGNFCTGASCIVERNGVRVAELVIAKAVEDCSVALITSIDDEQTLRVGDVVKLKMITF